MKFVTASGQSIELSGRCLGRGGEGEVRPVNREPGLAAKIYHRPTFEHEQKLNIMIAKPPASMNGRPWVAWPRELLFSAGPNRRFVGYLMPKLENARQVFEWYNPTVRRKMCPGFDFRYLVRAGRNLAAAVARAHETGYTIGDLNESNILVGDDAQVSFIDADSWQVPDTKRRIVHRCPVGKADFLAPELQGQNLALIDRRVCHDQYALAILIFKLLNEGTHPFDGVFKSAGDPPPIEVRIAKGELPFLNASSRWSPKPTAIPFGALALDLQQLFIKNFVHGHADPGLRPSARSWRDALERAEGGLRVCSVNAQHWTWGPTCVWCERNALIKIDSFPARPRPGNQSSPGQNPAGKKSNAPPLRSPSCPHPAQAYPLPAPVAAPRPPSIWSVVATILVLGILLNSSKSSTPASPPSP